MFSGVKCGRRTYVFLPCTFFFSSFKTTLGNGHFINIFRPTANCWYHGAMLQFNCLTIWSEKLGRQKLFLKNCNEMTDREREKKKE